MYLFLNSEKIGNICYTFFIHVILLTLSIFCPFVNTLYFVMISLVLIFDDVVPLEGDIVVFVGVVMVVVVD